MPTVPLAKPGTIGVAVIEQADDAAEGFLVGAKNPSMGFNPLFYMKVQRMTMRYRAPLLETSGDCDQWPVWENGRWTYLQFTLAGFMVEMNGTPLGILELREQDQERPNPMDVPGPRQITINFSSGMSTTFRAIIEDISIGWDRRGPLIPLQFTGRSTDDQVGEIS